MDVVMSKWFSRFAMRAADWTGRFGAFVIAAGIIVVWAIAGPIFGFSETWQLVINTATTIVTFLMVFLIQNSQNRDSAAIHLKLDEIIRAIEAASNQMIDAEEEDDEELQKLKEQYRELRTNGRSLGAARK
jgi:low affinity Fe/Cu permease